MSSPEELPIALVGLRGVGKTTVGRMLARELGLAFHDLDEETARLAIARGFARSGCDAGELLTQRGVEVFRACEQAALAARLGRQDEKFVLAAGGGAVEESVNRDLLRDRTFCVWLRAPPEVLAARVASDPAVRPPLVAGGTLSEARELARRRDPWFREVAALELDCGRLPPEEVAARLALRLRGGPAAT